LVLGAGVNNGAFATAPSLTMDGRGAYNITTAGVTISRLILGRGTYTLLDALTTSGPNTGTATFSCSGTLNAGANAVTTARFSGSASLTVLNASGTWTLNSIDAITVFGPLIPGASSCGSMTINLTGGADQFKSQAQIFDGSGNIFGTLNHTAVNTVKTLTFVGSNTFTNLNLGSGMTMKNTASAIQTVTAGLAVSGSPNAFLRLTGQTAGSDVNVPDSAALSITGDIGIAVRVALDSWSTGTSAGALVAKMASGSQQSYTFRVTSGFLSFRYTVLGSTLVTLQSTATVPMADGDLAWVYVTRNATTGDVKFYTAADSVSIPTVWTQLGATVAGTPSAIFDGTSIVEIGAFTPSGPWRPGKYYRAVIYSDITQTTKAFDADFTSKPFGADSFVESSANAATVSIVGAAQAGDGRLAIASTISGTTAALVLPLGAVVDYLVLSDCVSQGGPSTFAGANSVDHGGNAGWWFTKPPYPRAVAS